MNPGVGHQVSLKLSQINIKSAIKPERGSNGGNNLSNQTVQVRIGWAFNIKISATDLIDGLIINHKGTIRMFKGCVGGQDRVVRFNNSSGDLGCRVDSEFKLALLA